ncbi:phage head closure protein [Clostridium felsineum]|uniref:Uncharacterized protein n=1 Tax=Clostridium felsineum TaxID=36839 RepID=A0A1S8M2F8_9CLOT|nr:phage head closure protein [Clostridium felsineum]URZ06771.1 hypothetical protein CLROS_021040 [Clostridium felsineum]URZ11803.1 hypothetical protein CROST_025200 [Clostridium felsineum]
MVVDTGNLNKRITIGRTKIITNKGMQIKQFDSSTAIITWASVNGVGDNIFLADNNENNKNILNFIIRYRKNIEQQMLIKYKNDYYEIQGIDDYMEQHMFITLRTKRVNL